MLLTDYTPQPEPARRRCGRRKKGGAYWKTGVGPGGRPWWTFLKDPPVVLDFAAMGISARGLKLLPDSAGVFHAWDWIGASYWEFFPDYVEEGLRFEFSAYIPANFDWRKVTPGQSCRRAVHPRGALSNAPALWPTRLWDTCKTRQAPHTNQAAPWPADWHCIGFLWEMLTGEKVPAPAGDGDDDPRAVERVFDTFSYYGWTWPEGFVPEWQPAYVMDFPLTCVEIVRDPEGGTHEHRAEHIDRLNPALPLAIVEE